jgi:hypothetical protein
VVGLPSVSASSIAVIGRQKPSSYFARHIVMIASATLMSTAANIRAASTMSRSRTVTWSRSAALYCTSALPEKNSAVAVWSGVRTVELSEPSALTSSKSRV